MIRIRRVLAGLVLVVAARTVEPLDAQSRVLVLATTTSLHDTGLLDSLLPDFTRRSGWRVKVVAVGSGQALELGRRGDADVVVAHAPALERALTDSGYFADRRLLMHNDFVLAGPPADPAGVRGMPDVVGAFRRLTQTRAGFVSRSDHSGTHLVERDLWNRAGVAPPGPGSWYVEAGQGMAATLQMADQKHAYVLADRATYLAWRARLSLDVLVEGDTLLFNVYHVLVPAPGNAARINVGGARAFADFMVSSAVQRRIGEFGRARFGQSLFVPDAGKPDRW